MISNSFVVLLSFGMVKSFKKQNDKSETVLKIGFLRSVKSKGTKIKEIKISMCFD